MKTFLSQIVDKNFEKYGNKLSELCIVLPNRRAGLYIKKILSEKIEKPIWAPTIFSIEDFISEISDFQIADELRLLFELYGAHIEVEKENKQSFDDFMPWGTTLLHDFNDIDLYMVEATNLFGYLSDTKAISLWNTDGKPLSDFQKKYLLFYRSFYDYYVSFNKRLSVKHLTYLGAAYRKVAENIVQLSDSFTWEHIIFAGFNALNQSEETIIKYLVQSEKADFIPDADEYYLNDTLQEAGKFLREYKNTWASECFSLVGHGFAKTKSITLIGTSKNVSQVKFVGNYLHENSATLDLERTAIVLADEKLLIPMLGSIPESIEEFNFTMGFPLKKTPLYRFFDDIFQMHVNAEKYTTNNKGTDEIAFYYKDVLSVLQHPYFISIILDALPTNLSNADFLIKSIISSNKVFINRTDIQKIFNENKISHAQNILFPFESWQQKPSIALQCFSQLIEAIRLTFTKNANQNTDIEMEYLFHFSVAIRKTNLLIEEENIIQLIPTLHQLFRQIIGGLSLPFYGEPLKGLQVMGMLETRVLDFKNIVLLSANEGVLPSAKTQNSFIPIDIKNNFSLPTYRDHEAIFAYHFYHLLQRAENITILYNTDTDTFGYNERSRFISQLLHELPTYNPQIIIEEKILNIHPEIFLSNTEISIDKTPEVFNELLSKAKSGFAPTTLLKYINCPLQFYFTVVAGIEELDEVEETIDASTLGTVVHEVLELFYKPFIQKNITESDIKQMIPLIEKNTKRSFSTIYKNGDIDFGKNLLIQKVAIRFIERFLQKELETIAAKETQQLFILSLEEYLKSSITIDNSIEVLLKGKIDRIDSLNEIVRIIDYKTGSASTAKLIISDWQNSITDATFDKFFQLMMYAYLYSKNNDCTHTKVKAGIISFRNLSSGLLTVSIGDSKGMLTQFDFDNFENQLLTLLNTIFDKEIPFSQTPEKKNCKYCLYTGICRV